MKIIVGLGNIGTKYLKTRHNCGFLVLDHLVEELEKKKIEINWKEDRKFNAFIAKVIFADNTILLAKPATLMNNSGEAVSKILHFFKEPLSNLIVISDDIDLPLGKIRIREKGSPGTHNGLRSVIQELGSENFKRIRIGIESRGELTPKQQDISDFVLSDFNEKEIPIITKSIKEVTKHLVELILA